MANESENLVLERLRGMRAGFRREVFEYQSSVVGHGALISERESRMRRVEDHLSLSPIGAN